MFGKIFKRRRPGWMRVDGGDWWCRVEVKPGRKWPAACLGLVCGALVGLLIWLMG